MFWIIIWRGWGILVVPLTAVSLLAGIGVDLAFRHFGLAEHIAIGLGMIAAAVTAGLSIWFSAKALSRGPQRRLVDEETGQRFVVKRSAGSLFFIPMRFWAFILAVPGLMLGLFMIFEPLVDGVHAPLDRSPAEAQSAAQTASQ